jgi:hypothetical protein
VSSSANGDVGARERCGEVPDLKIAERQMLQEVQQCRKVHSAGGKNLQYGVETSCCVAKGEGGNDMSNMKRKARPPPGKPGVAA